MFGRVDDYVDTSLSEFFKAMGLEDGYAVWDTFKPTFKATFTIEDLVQSFSSLRSKKGKLVSVSMPYGENSMTVVITGIEGARADELGDLEFRSPHPAIFPDWRFRAETLDGKGKLTEDATKIRGYLYTRTDGSIQRVFVQPLINHDPSPFAARLFSDSR